MELRYLPVVEGAKKNCSNRQRNDGVHIADADVRLPSKIWKQERDWLADEHNALSFVIDQ